MTKLGHRIGAIALALSAASSPLTAAPASDLLILSDKFGRPMTVGAQVDLREQLTGSALSGVAAVDYFAQLCLKAPLDKAAFEAAAATPALALSANQLTLPAAGKASAYASRDFRTDAVIASFWEGDDAGLKSRPIAIRDHGITVTGQYGPFKAAGHQCNVSGKLRDIGDLQAMADRLTAVIGATPTKLVVKPRFADGIWSTPSRPAHVSFSVVDAGKPAALVHLTIQEIEGAKP